MSNNLTREQKMEILDRYYARTGDGKEFAKKEGWPLKTIYNWSTQDKKLWRPEAKGKAVQVGEDVLRMAMLNEKEINDSEYWKSLYLQEREKVESLQKVVVVMGHQI